MQVTLIFLILHILFHKLQLLILQKQPETSLFVIFAQNQEQLKYSQCLQWKEQGLTKMAGKQKQPPKLPWMEKKVSIPTGRGESKSTAKWSADGKSLTIVTVASYNGNGGKSTGVWTLTDSNTVSVASQRQNRDGQEVKTGLEYE